MQTVAAATTLNNANCIAASMVTVPLTASPAKTAPAARQPPSYVALVLEFILICLKAIS